MHRAIGFFHRPRPTRFELYLGARLNELVPVVTWYGPEQALRLREGRFDRERAGREPEARLGDARWLRDRRHADSALELAGDLLREGIAHFERELDAIDRELRTGETVRVPHPFLDASSDAIGYVLGHADYLRGDDAADVLGRFARLGIERFDRVATFRDHVEASFDRLLFAPIALSFDAALGERRARHAWDYAQRAARLGPSTYRRFGRAIDEATAVASRARSGGSPPLDELELRIESALGERARAILALGDRARPHGADLGRMQSALGATCAATLDRVDVESLADALIASDELFVRASLPARVARLADGLGDARLADLARFDAAIARASRADRAGEALADERHDDDDGFVIANASFEALALDHDVLAGPPYRRRATAMLVGRHRDVVSVVPIPPRLLSVVARLTKAPMSVASAIAEIRAESSLSVVRARALLDALVVGGAVSRRSIGRAP